MNRIQRQPRGLLSFLGMVGTGTNPTNMADSVAAVHKVNEHYLSTLLAARRTAGTVQNAGNVLDLTVPAGELWWVRAISATVTPLTGEIATISCGIRLPNTITTWLAQSDQRTMASNGNIRIGVWLGEGLILGPGNTVRMTLDQSTLAAARNADVTCMAAIITGT